MNPFLPILLPFQMDLDRARELALDMGCTHEVTDRVVTLGDSQGYAGGETITLSTHFGTLAEVTVDERGPLRMFVEAFHLGMTDTDRTPLRNVHDHRAGRNGGREWHPNVLSKCGEIAEIPRSV